MSGRGFVGRVAELRVLEAELAAAARGRSRVLLLLGSAGVGKTRMLDELRRRSRLRARWLLGRGSPLATAVPYAAVTEALETQLVRLPHDVLVELSRGSALAGHLPSLTAHLDGDAGPDRSPVAVFAGVRDLLADFASRGGHQSLVLAVDDVHQADPSTRDLIGYLARNPWPAPVLVIAGCRSEALTTDPVLAAWVGAMVKDGLATELDLQPLEATDLAELATQAIGPVRATAALVDWLVERSRGNALFATALLDDLEVDPSSRTVPASVRERVRLLVGQLPDAARDVLDAAAVLGGRFGVPALAALVEPGDEVWLDELCRRGLLVEPSPLAQDHYDFVHPLVQEAVYDGMGAIRRRTLHRRAVDALADEPLPVRAYHAARGALPGDSDALGLIVAAARAAESAQVHRQAIALLQSALTLVREPGGERAQLLDELAWQAGCVGDHLVGVPALRELETLVTADPVARGGVQIRLASLLAWGEGDLVGAEVAARSAVALFADAGEAGRSGGAVNELAWVQGAAGDLAAQISGGRDALAVAERQGSEEGVLHALGTLGHALALTGEVAEATELLRRGGALAAAREDHAQVEWFTAVLVEAHLGVGRIRDAQAELDEYDATGMTPVDLLPSRRAMVQWYRGQWPDALDSCRAAQALNPIAAPIHSAFSLSLGAALATATGRRAEAAPLLAQADRVYRGRRLYWMSARNEWATGLAAWLAGDIDGAVRAMSSGADWARQMGAVVVEAQILPDLVEVLVGQGDAEAARAAADRLDTLARRLGAEFVDDQATYARALVDAASGRVDKAAGALARVADAGARVPAPFVQARALEHLGECLAGSAAIGPLTEAAKGYARLPAPDLEQRARRALRGLGEDGRRSARQVGDLTPREREVLSLARSTMTAKDIANRLHISERTVETHLANLYRKLEVSGRRELQGDVPVP